MIGLCANHHKMIHMIEHKEFLRDVVERLLILKKIRGRAISIIQEEPDGGPSLMPQTATIKQEVDVEQLATHKNPATHSSKNKYITLPMLIKT